jgi:peptide/nickel transport system ATP-binding protein
MSSETPADAAGTVERLHVAGLSAPTDAVLSIRDLNVRFNTENGVVHAVRGVGRARPSASWANPVRGSP